MSFTDNNQHIFFQLFRNKCIRKLIFLKVKEYNESLFYITYNYYQLPLLSIIKLRNHTLLIEKINLHNKYINNNSNNNDIRNNNKKIYKYYLNINKECIEELFKWKDIEVETIKLIFNSFENEIESMKNSKLHPNSTLEISNYFIHLFNNENIKVLEYLLLERNEKFKKLEEYFYNIDFSLPKAIDFCILIFDNPRLYDYKAFFTNSKVCSILEKTIQSKSTHIFGELFINFISNSTPINSSVEGDDKKTTDLRDELQNLASMALLYNDKEMLKLLINKARELYKLKLAVSGLFSSSSSSKSKKLFLGTKDEVLVNLELLKLLGITEKTVYQSNMYELLEFLLESEYKEFKITPKFGSKVVGPYKSIVISNPKILKYLVDNHLTFILNNEKIFSFKLSCIPDENEEDKEYFKKYYNNFFSNSKIKWDFQKNQHINFKLSKNKLMVLKNKYIQNTISNNIADQIVSENDSELLKYFIDNFKPKIFFYKTIDTAIKNNNLEILEPLFSIITKAANPPSKDWFSDIIQIFFLSIKHNNDYVFDLFLIFIRDKYIEFFNELKIRQSIYQAVLKANFPKSNLIARIGYIEKLKQIQTFIEPFLFNETIIYENDFYENDHYSSISFNKYYFNNQDIIISSILNDNQQLTTGLSKLIIYSIKNNNLKFYKFIINLSINTIPNQKELLEIISNIYINLFTKFENCNINKSILYLISIYNFSIDFLSFIIKLSIKTNNFKIINIILCRNSNNNAHSLKETPFKFKRQQQSQILITSFDQYISLVNYYILKHSIDSNYSIDLIKYLVTDNYSYELTNTSNLSSLSFIQNYFNDILNSKQEKNNSSLLKLFIYNTGLIDLE